MKSLGREEKTDYNQAICSKTPIYPPERLEHISRRLDSPEITVNQYPGDRCLVRINYSS
jgi:hypothetical protein